MQTADWLTVIALLVSPLIALEVSEWLERRRGVRQRRLDVFRTLMTTRATPVHFDHVRALNSIDIEFAGGGKRPAEVMSIWRTYLAHLSDRTLASERWVEKGEDCLIDLLYAMSACVGYTFTKDQLKRTSYFPVGHGQLEDELATIRRSLVRVLSGELPIAITPHQPSDRVEAPPQVNASQPVPARPPGSPQPLPPRHR